MEVITEFVANVMQNPVLIVVCYIGTSSGPAVLSFVERLPSFRDDFLKSVYTRVLSACPLLGGLSSFRVSLIGGFTAQ